MIVWGVVVCFGLGVSLCRWCVLMLFILFVFVGGFDYVCCFWWLFLWVGCRKMLLF